MEKLQTFYPKILFTIGLLSLILSSCENKDASYYFDLQGDYHQGSVKEQEYLDKAIELDSLFDKAWVEKSVPYNKRGDFATGMYYLNKGLDINPLDHLGYRGFVKLYMLRDYKGALQDFLKLDSLTPGFRDALWGEDIDKVIGLTYLGLQNIEQASESFEKSIQLITNDIGEEWVEPNTFLYLGICNYKRSKLDSAIYYFNKKIFHDPDSPSGYYWLSYSLMKKKKYDKKHIKRLLNKSYHLAQNGGLENNSYYELPFQLYLSDIKQLQNEYKSE